MSERHQIIPVWFFVGALLLVYGVLIFGAGIAELSHPPGTVLASLHAAIWWGAVLFIVGLFYTIRFWPRRGGK